MKHHDGIKKINKVDGGKKRAKKQYHKKLRTKKIEVFDTVLQKTLEVEAPKRSKKVKPLNISIEGMVMTEEEKFMAKSEPEKERTIVEQVLSERNLTGFVKPEDFPSVAPVVFENQLGKVRIEGEVTPQKMAFAKQFNDIFEQATGEIMDLDAYTPDPATLEFVKGQRLSQQKIDEIKNAPAWTIFNIGGENLMKTQDNKLENVKNYCYRLEREVIGQINVRKQEVARLEEILNLRDHEPTRNLFLKIKEVYVSFKNALLQLISK